MKQSSKHHYVPEWYQRRFMEDGQTAYYRLDLNPEKIVIPSGKVIKKDKVLKKGPKKFFYETDLYTTRYFGVENDDIETYLFGKIDSEGALAIDALASEDWMKRIHPHIQHFYEYMDAQRLRTPKGLTWLTKTLKPRDHNELLLQMQNVRQMHCTMWIEASMEIVSANDSDIKFIVSDNPVTFYNPALYPGNEMCTFPLDPGIELQGTRTIFPLDLNHCAILTNLEYARKPGRNKAVKTRTNPRFFGQTIIKYADTIRERELNSNQVLVINHILKMRAHRFIAASDEAWLYPERHLKSKNWAVLDKVFKSNSLKLLGQGGEIFIGGKDGKLLATQDEFGRKPKNKQEWDKKQKQAEELEKTVNKALRNHFKDS